MLNFRNRQLITEPLPLPWHVDCSYNVAQNIPIGDNFKSQYRMILKVAVYFYCINRRLALATLFSHIVQHR